MKMASTGMMQTPTKPQAQVRNDCRTSSCKRKGILRSNFYRTNSQFNLHIKQEPCTLHSSNNRQGSPANKDGNPRQNRGGKHMKRDIERIKKHLEEYNSLFPASKDKKRTQSKDDPEKISSDHYSRSKKKRKTVESPAKDDIFISKQVTVMRGTFEKIKRTKVKLAVKKKIYFTVFEQKQTKQRQSPRCGQDIQGSIMNSVDRLIHWHRFFNHVPEIVRRRKCSKQKSIHAGRRSLSVGGFNTGQAMTHVNAGIARSPWKTRLSIGRNHDDLTHRNADYEWAIKKLKEYKFLDGYITEGEITEKLRKYEKKGEKVCKWPMLVIDEVYSKIKVEDK